MASNLLASLAVAGVLQRTGRRAATRLRVAPRFLAHAEATSARRQAGDRPADALRTLQEALATWDEYHGDPRHGAQLLLEFMEAHDQMGSVRPVFPALEHYVPGPVAVA